MHIRIYQINLDRDNQFLAFAGTDILYDILGRVEVDSSIYDPVFNGTTRKKTLEGVFTQFNVDRPKDFYGRSMSVSDVLEIVTAVPQTHLAPGFYFCDSYGWRRISFDPTSAGGCP